MMQSRNAMPRINVTGLIRAVALALLLAACGKPALDPAEAMRQADAAIAAGDAEHALALLEEAIRNDPAEPSLRIALARAELAAGHPDAAEGALRRASALGATQEAVVPVLAQSLMAQHRPSEVLDLLGKPGEWPAPMQPTVKTLIAEAWLATPSASSRRIIKSFIAAFRASDPAGAADPALDSVRRRLDALRAGNPVVEGAWQHYSCHQPSAGPESLGPSGSPPHDDADRRVLQVGPTRELKRPSDAARVARDGDIIEIDAATYPRDVAEWPQNRLELRGVGGRPLLDAQGRSAGELGIWVFRGNDIVVENIEFANARGRDRNGSGIRFFGRNLTVRHSVFRDNEDGILTWKDPESDVLIEYSEFARNGYGDGLSHNIYVGEMRSLTLRFSYSHDSRSGHEVKSRASVNRILYNRLTDENDGNSSYIIDLPEGGDGVVLGNFLMKGFHAENPHAISYAAERRDIESGSLYVVNNDFHNRRPKATFVINRSEIPVKVINNVLTGAPAGLLSGPGETTSNFTRPDAGLADPAKLDFSVEPDSPLIDAGTDPGRVNDFVLWPQYEYVHPLGGRARPRVYTLDIGAMEFCGW